MLTFKLDKSRMKQGVEFWSETTRRMPQEVKGLKGLVLLTQSHGGKCVSLGFWESAADSNAFGASALYRDFITKLESMCVETPTREQLEVRGGNLSALRLAEGRLAAA